MRPQSGGFKFETPGLLRGGRGGGGVVFGAGFQHPCSLPANIEQSNLDGTGPPTNVLLSLP